MVSGQLKHGVSIDFLKKGGGCSGKTEGPLGRQGTLGRTRIRSLVVGCSTLKLTTFGDIVYQTCLVTFGLKQHKIRTSERKSRGQGDMKMLRKQTDKKSEGANECSTCRGADRCELPWGSVTKAQCDETGACATGKHFPVRCPLQEARLVSS
ncbi:hypothetical protein PoB_006920400 [Plakobranchus ocellatus]|uniref:Uncharacterized protein n=1 Tax=Plakobranchus ocellatus TaxID=259542 RepID=A0AAV4DER5_9GAST|nr:hypothetical protein PoB_006920400 [Plakobranchus ocellatus]